MRSPMERRAARVLLVDPDSRVLLFYCKDPGRPSAPGRWMTPGGGALPSENLQTAGKREVLEETGLVVELHEAPVYSRRTQFDFDGVRYDQFEEYFLVRVPRSPVSTDRWDASERRSIRRYRWWPLPDLLSTRQIVEPQDLGMWLGRIITGGLE